MRLLVLLGSHKLGHLPGAVTGHIIQDQAYAPVMGHLNQLAQGFHTAQIGIDSIKIGLVITVIAGRWTDGRKPGSPDAPTPLGR